MFIVSALSNMGTGDIKSGILRSKNTTILQARCASALSCSNMWKSNYPHRHVNAIALHVFVAATVKLQTICHQRTRLFTIGAAPAPVETIKLVPMTHYDVSITSPLAKNI